MMRRTCVRRYGNAQELVGDAAESSHAYGLMRGSSIKALVSVFFLCKSPSPDPPFGRLLTWRPKRELGSLGPLDWPAARVSCFDVLVWLPSAVRHGAEGGETCAIRTGIGTWLGEGGRGVVVSYRSE